MKRFEEHDWERFEEALRDPEPWTLAEALLAPPADPGALRSLAAQLDEERTSARELLAPLLESLSRFEAANIASDPAFQTRGVVDVLNESARPLRNAQPLLALAAATAAVTIAANLTAVEACGLRVLGAAHVERAWALFFVGRYRDAEEALRQADLAFDADRHATDWDRAHVSLVRANVCVETHRLDEASDEALSAAAAFDSFGDQKYYLAASLVEGGIRLMQRDYVGGAEVLDRLAEKAARAGDRLHVARARQTAGNCYIELGEHATAAAYFHEALEIWDELGLDTERVRTNWSLGVLAKSRGNLDEAVARIDEARRAFERMGIVNDAALARLELAEVLLVADRPAEVAPLLRDLVVSFTSEGMMRNARLALAYLREAVEAGGIEAGVIRRVREYLEELPANPTSSFFPLA
ncbi:MAG TPA: tetratricopeptide repeat protein [Thermoanaerobaculia bacterium]|nr:tetratricopeptide repeat protein [Thermoanaerobaculia bacterium]